MKIKVGDTVTVIAGSDKGKTGKVTKTIKKDNRVIVEGVHIVHKHIKPNRMNETGGILEVEAPIHVSNVKLVDEKKATKAAKKEETVKATKEEKTTKAPAKKVAAKKATKKESEK